MAITPDKAAELNEQELSEIKKVESEIDALLKKLWRRDDNFFIEIECKSYFMLPSISRNNLTLRYNHAGWSIIISPEKKSLKFSIRQTYSGGDKD